MTYLWRDIDAQWWKTVKAAAKASNMNVREFLVDRISLSLAFPTYEKAKTVDAVDTAESLITDWLASEEK